MSILSVSRTDPPLDGYGELQITRVGERIVIDQADPLILVTRALVTIMRRGDTHPDVEISQTRIVVNGTNRRVAYTLGRYLSAIDCYEAALNAPETVAPGAPDD